MPYPAPPPPLLPLAVSHRVLHHPPSFLRFGAFAPTKGLRIHGPRVLLPGRPLPRPRWLGGRAPQSCSGRRS
eukprot:5289495-Pyramimonas_sp.AAC.1